MLKIINKNKLFALVICLILLCFSGQLTWADTVENDEVFVEYDTRLKGTASEVVSIYSLVKVELEKTFKSKVDFKPTVRIIKDRSTFQKTTGSIHAVAVAISQNNLIIIDNSKMGTHPFTLEVTLKHELCHLFLHRLVENGRLPRWFNEGVSQWVSGGITELIIGENRDLLKQATLSGRYIRISDLSERFPQDSTSLKLSYQESKSIVDYIVKEHGPDSILRIINHLKEGSSIDVALLRALSMSTGELEKRWHAHLKRKYTWLTYLSNNIYQILFTFAGLALLYGFIRVMLRKRAYKDEDDDDYEENVPPPL
jgi:hypothetical protein